VMVPGVIALLAIYVRATCPESPWVRAHDRKRRIADTLAAGGTLSDEDRAWSTKACVASCARPDCRIWSPRQERLRPGDSHDTPSLRLGACPSQKLERLLSR
jgi:hypothetical protein